MKLLSQENLLIILGVVLSVKFLVAPLWGWQQAQIAQLKSKSRHYEKASSIVANRDNYAATLAHLVDGVNSVRGYFYVSSDTLKLEVQRELETIFAANDLTLTGFNWLLDTQDPLRRLRVQLTFNGSQTQMIKTFWALSRSPKIKQQVEWRQQMKSFKPNELGLTALIQAAAGGHTETATALLVAPGLDVNAARYISWISP